MAEFIKIKNFNLNQMPNIRKISDNQGEGGQESVTFAFLALKI
jgi:hypothetical protein